MVHKVLFVCSGNTCRSPLADVLFRDMIVKNQAENLFRSASAGLLTVDDLPASTNAIVAAEEQNLDLAGHLSQQLKTPLIDTADLILTMTAGHKQFVSEHWPQAAEKTHVLKEFAGCCGDILDPFGGSLAAYRLCLREIGETLEAAWPALLALAAAHKKENG